MKRRDFFKFLGATGTVVVLPKEKAEAVQAIQIQKGYLQLVGKKPYQNFNLLTDEKESVISFTVSSVQRKIVIVKGIKKPMQTAIRRHRGKLPVKYYWENNVLHITN